jgi:hypothetical protein
LSLADCKEWDLTCSTCACTCYSFQCLISIFGCSFSMPLSISPLCPPEMLWPRCWCAILWRSSTSLLSTSLGLQLMISQSVALHNLSSASRMYSYTYVYSTSWSPGVCTLQIEDVWYRSNQINECCDGCVCHPGAIVSVSRSVLPQYLKPLIVYIFSFQVEIPLWQSKKNWKANNDVYSILWHQLGVCFPTLGIGRRVGWLNSWNMMGTTQCALRCTRYDW